MLGRTLENITMPTKTIDVREAQTQLTELISLVAAGTEIILTDGVKPVARLVPLAVAASQRTAGLHKDPFDRLLIAQANVEDAILVSHDTAFAQYQVKVQW